MHRRAQAIKEMISRSVTPMSQEDHEFLVDTLKIPAIWIYSAQVSISFSLPHHVADSPNQATAAKYNGDVFLEFELRLAAKDLNGAHDIVVSELAPEAVLRGDLGVLRRLLQPLTPDVVVNWDVGGQVSRSRLLCGAMLILRLQVYLDYADAMQGVGDREVDVELIEGLAKTYRGLKMSACVQEMKENLIKLSPTLIKVGVALLCLRTLLMIFLELLTGEEFGSIASVASARLEECKLLV